MWPYLVTFLLGVLVAWQGCGTGTKTITETIEIEKPVYRTEYVDRWKTDTVRFVERVTVTDTVTNTIIQEREVLKIDTVKIIEAWLTEVNRYDTTITLADGSLNATWYNYQNITEEAAFTYTSNVQKAPMYGMSVFTHPSKHRLISSKRSHHCLVLAFTETFESCILLPTTSSMVTIMLV